MPERESAIVVNRRVIQRSEPVPSKGIPQHWVSREQRIFDQAVVAHQVAVENLQRRRVQMAGKFQEIDGEVGSDVFVAGASHEPPLPSDERIQQALELGQRQLQIMRADREKRRKENPPRRRLGRAF